MDDLNGLDFSASSKIKTAPIGTGNYYPALRPTPPPSTTGRASPLSTQSSGIAKSTIPAPKTSTGDSFSNLVAFGSGKSASNTLSLQEQQARLQIEKARKTEEQRKQYDQQFGNTQFWDGLGKGSNNISTFSGLTHNASQPLNPGRSSPLAKPPLGVEEDDLFAAFNKDTKVDKSSHYPPPSDPASRNGTPVQIQENRLDLSNPEAWSKTTSNDQSRRMSDDDPFGLNGLVRRNTPIATHNGEDDDFLGELGKPVDAFRSKAPHKEEVPTTAPVDAHADSVDPWDRAVSELVDMGFSAEQSRRALTESGTGLDVQAAVGWLLNDAHRQAKEKKQSQGAMRPEHSGPPSSNGSRADSHDRSRNDAVPAWMRQEVRDGSQPRRDQSTSPASGEVDITRMAASAGSSLLKTANSLWKTSQKKVQQAVSEFQQESDPHQPKWMRSTPADDHSHATMHASPSNVTDEAMMLEGSSKQATHRTKQSQRHQSEPSSSRDQSPSTTGPSTGRSTPAPRWQQAIPVSEHKSRLNKQTIEEQSAQAYVSPARRKKAAPASRPAPEAEPSTSIRGAPNSKTPPALTDDLLSREASKPRPTPQAAPIAVRPKASLRNIPNLTPAALSISTKQRMTGTEHYKRGDYAAAHASYSSSLSALPQGHPITIVLLCNRSLTALKIGEPKTAVIDADEAIKLIGPSRGDNEVIDLQDNTSPKQMKESWGKALTRKAEALEQMERWADAGTVWKEAIEAGVGGASAAQGRQRCEKALAPKPKPAALPVQKPVAKAKPVVEQDSAAVKRMRIANAAAEKADDEKFALSDSVDARVKAWREGRQDNLRALLGGLDQVLWEGSGWKKVGMHDLVMNGKVKINYMKAIAKVHPDKVRFLNQQDADSMLILPSLRKIQVSKFR